MILGQFSANKNASRKAVVALTLFLTGVSSFTTANAQYAGGYANGAAPTQDSLLPPEVVPMDPSTASSMATQQAENRAQFGDGQVPGLAGANGANGMMSAQDMRKAAFESLYGQGQLQQNQQPMQWQSSGVALDQYPGQNNGQVPGLVPGQGQQNGQQNPMMGLGQNQMSSPTYAPYQPAASQTLSGGTKNQPKIRDTRRGGITNTVSSLASIGAGAFAAGALLHPQSPMVGAGIFGLTMSGFGSRNGFRF